MDNTSDKSGLQKRIGWALATLLVLVLSWAALQIIAPPLRIHCNETGVIFDFQTLGEYPTTIKRVRLLDATGSVVWEIRAEKGTPQIHRIALNIGDNSVFVDADSGTYRVIFPQSKDHFSVTKGQRYQIQVWRGLRFLPENQLIS